MSADNNRRFENLIRVGRIESVIPSTPFHKVIVNLGDIVTDELRLLNLRAGSDKTHDLPTVGEECVVFSPCGELALGIVVTGLNNTDFPTPSQDPNIKLRLFEDGALISYDVKAHSLQAILPSDGTATISANGGVTVNADAGVTVNANSGVVINSITGGTTINGDTIHNGNVFTNGSNVITGNNTVGGSQLVQGSSHSTGDFSTEADVKAGDISLKQHKTSGVKGGSDTSGVPIP